MPEFKISPTEFHLLRKENEAQGELLAKERLERKAEVDQLRLEVAALKTALAKLINDFPTRYREAYSERLHNFDPDIDRPELARTVS